MKCRPRLIRFTLQPQSRFDVNFFRWISTNSLPHLCCAANKAGVTGAEALENPNELDCWEKLRN
jgi:hypothetical protein